MSSSESLPWVDRPLTELVRLAWPVTVSMLSFSLMSLVDMFLIGRLGKEPLAGVGLGGTIAFTLVSFGFGMLRGGKTLVSQAVGAGRRDEAGGYLGASLLFGVLFGALAIGLALPIGLLLSHAAATPGEAACFRTYLIARSLGAPSSMCFTALREVRYGQGDARSPMIATIVANIVNAVLAWAFIYPLHLGVAGAGFATSIAQTVELGVLALYQQRDGWGISSMTRAHLVALVHLGVPSGLQTLLEMGAFTLLAVMVASMSPAQMAAHQITLQIISFSFLPAYAVGESAAVMVGQAIGAARDDLLLPVARLAARVVTSYTGLCSVIFAGFAPSIIAAFTPEADVRGIGARLLRVSVVFLAMDGLNIVSRSVLRGAGDVRFSAIVGVVCSWCLTPPLAWLLGFHFGLGAFGGWAGLSGEVFLGALLQWTRMWRGGWRQHAERTRAAVMAASAV